MARLTPVEKPSDRVSVCGARVFVADVSREELYKAPRRLLAGARNQRRKRIEAGAGEFAIGNWDNGEGQTG